jgi:hypothetical protein
MNGGMLISRVTIAVIGVTVSGIVGGPAAASGASTGLGPQITNRWSPMPPGVTYISYGVQDGRFSLDRTTVLSRTKLIDGVRCRVERDDGYLNGKLVERTYDYFAQDARGNVWYYGEDSYTPTRSGLRRNSDSWLTGVDGARPGIVMQSHPRASAPYAQENWTGHAEDRARVLGFVSSVTVPGGTFRHVLETEEFSPLEPGVLERKYYALGLGFIASVTTRGPVETLQLVRTAR